MLTFRDRWLLFTGPNTIETTQLWHSVLWYWMYFYFGFLSTDFRTEPNQKLLINFGLLKPFWQMYDNLTKQAGEPSSILPPVVRSLTELFLQVENLAMVSQISLSPWSVILEIYTVDIILSVNNLANTTFEKWIESGLFLWTLLMTCKVLTMSSPFTHPY